jgi:uncharacterized protein (UPF0218 family)
MQFNLKIPVDKRHKFAKPLDKLIAGSRQETIPEVERIIKDYELNNYKINVYIVGDVVKEDFLSNLYLRPFVKLCIVDEKTKRKKFESGTKEFFEETVDFINPEGTLQKESWKILEKLIISNKPSQLKIVQGEEDLLLLPLVLLIPLEEKKTTKQLVFYGQPPITDAIPPIPQGIVIVDVRKKIKKVVRKYISLMEKY